MQNFDLTKLYFTWTRFAEQFYKLNWIKLSICSWVLEKYAQFSIFTDRWPLSFSRSVFRVPVFVIYDELNYLILSGGVHFLVKLENKTNFFQTHTILLMSNNILKIVNICKNKFVVLKLNAKFSKAAKNVIFATRSKAVKLCLVSCKFPATHINL